MIKSKTAIKIRNATNTQKEGSDNKDDITYNFPY